jgi:hypothetical protein
MFTIRLPRVILIFEYPQYNSAKTAGTASAISLADVKTNDATSFFMCGVGNSTAASDITMCVNQKSLYARSKHIDTYLFVINLGYLLQRLDQN